MPKDELTKVDRKLGNRLTCAARARGLNTPERVPTERAGTYHRREDLSTYLSWYGGVPLAGKRSALPPIAGAASASVRMEI